MLLLSVMSGQIDPDIVGCKGLIIVNVGPIGGLSEVEMQTAGR